jgi:hypothetical protein
MASTKDNFDPMFMERQWFINKQHHVKVILPKGTGATLKDLGVLNTIGFSTKFKSQNKAYCSVFKLSLKSNKLYALRPTNLHDMNGRMHEQVKIMMKEKPKLSTFCSKLLLCAFLLRVFACIVQFVALLFCCHYKHALQTSSKSSLRQKQPGSTTTMTPARQPPP